MIYYSASCVCVKSRSSGSNPEQQLEQDSKPVAYASRALTTTEGNYAQIRKELLAIVFGAERYYQFTYGRPVMVESDHKPLETIFFKSLASAPKRLQKMLIRLQRYHLVIRYKKGKEMYLADTLSSHYLKPRTVRPNSPKKPTSAMPYPIALGRR